MSDRMTIPAGGEVVDERPAPSPIRIAMIDADSGFVRVVTNRLDTLGWPHRVLGSPVPPDALVAMRLNALVIDLELLGPQGWAYLERICQTLPGLGVVVCTGRSSVAQRVRGLRLGADDWLTKPCHPEELIARVEAVVRRRKRSEPRAETGARTVGELEIRRDQFQAFVDGTSIDLTRREFELITLLADAEGQVLQREEMYQRVWGYAMAHGDRSVDVFVRKLRQKLKRRSPGWRYIHTHFGIGYRFAAERAGGAESAAAAPELQAAATELDDTLGGQATDASRALSRGR
jgi:DNA-binding response OmpR family regulator